MQNLTKKTVNSTLWSAIERFVTQAIKFALSIVIARMLSPEDYGVVAMVMIFIAIAETFIDSGFSNALIHKQDRSETDFSTIFYVNLILGFVAYAILFFSKGIIADFYNQPILIDIIPIVGLNIIVSSFRIVQKAKLTISLDFKNQAYISTISVLVSGAIAIYLAYLNYGVWVLVLQTLISNALITILMWVKTKWKPLCTFSTKSFNELFSYGSKLLLAGLMHTVYSNLYTLIIGKKFSTSDLGAFSQGRTFSYFVPGNVTNVLTNAMFPILCSIHDDKERTKNAFLKYIRVSCFIFFPCMILLSVQAESLIKLLLTDKWIESILYIQILSIAYMWDPVMRMNANILSIMGRTDYAFKSEVLKKTLSIAVLILTLPFGLTVICLGLAFYVVIDFLVVCFFVKRVIGVSHIDEIKSIFPTLILSLVMGVVAYYMRDFFELEILKILVPSLSAIIIYISVAKALRFKDFEIITKELIRR